jgi:hypothetical protein
LGGHAELRSNRDSIKEVKCSCRVSSWSIYEWKFLLKLVRRIERVLPKLASK